MISTKEIKRLLVDELSRAVENKVILAGMKFYETKYLHVMEERVQTVIDEMSQEYPDVKFKLNVLNYNTNGDYDSILVNMEFKKGGEEL